MTSLSVYLEQEGYDHFEGIRKLTEEDSLSDPEDNPFKSKYAARNILKSMIEKVGEIVTGSEDDLQIGIVGLLQLKLGENFAECEELSTGEEHIKKCVTILEPFCLKSTLANLYQTSLNELGILWSQRRNYNKAFDYLQKSEIHYREFKHEVGNNPVMMSELSKPPHEDEQLNKKRESNFEDTYTHTLYYFAQVYAKLDEPKKAAEYCHVTLKRQLITMQYDALDWSLNAATLSQYYMQNNRFSMARHCLASASFIFQELGEIKDENSCETEEEWQKFEKKAQAKADICRCWIKYAMALMEVSRDRLTEEELDLDQDVKDLNINYDKQEATHENGADEISVHDYKKSDLTFDIELTFHEEAITDKWLLDLDDARKVFLQAQTWSNNAKVFYKLDGHCSDYIEIIQDQSKLYKFLTFFDPDLERQCKMHKRRIDILSECLKELSPQFYLLVCRQLMFEIAETYSTMVDTKTAIIEASGERPSGHALKKINTLISQSISQYDNYLQSLKAGQSDFPETFSDDNLRPALIAMFYLGRLHSKYIELDPLKNMKNIKASLDHYQFIVKYCHRNPMASEKVSAELEICKEMVELLPLKLDKLRAATA